MPNLIARSKTVLLLVVSILALALVSIGAAKAQVVYSNGDYSTGFGGATITFASQADDLVVGSSLTFNRIRLWAIDDNLPGLLNTFSGTLSWFFYEDAGGFPAASIVASGSSSNVAVIDTGVLILNSPGYELAQLEFDIPSTTLATGTYWLRLKENGPAVPDDGTAIYWVFADGVTGFPSVGSSNEVNPTIWGGHDADYDFTYELLNVQAPEPSPIALILSTVITGTVFLRRRR